MNRAEVTTVAELKAMHLLLRKLCKCVETTRGDAAMLWQGATGLLAVIMEMEQAEEAVV